MTDAKFERIKTRIRREIVGTLTTSLWIAIALAALTLGISLWVTVISAALAKAALDELELGYLVCFGFALFNVMVHFVTRTDAKTRADDLIEEIETDLFMVPHDAL